MRKFETLSSLVSLRSGNTPSMSNEAFWGGEMPWVSAKDFDGSRLSSSSIKLTNAGRDVAKIANKNDLLLLVRGNLKKGIPIAICDREIAFNQDVKCITCSSKILPEYLLYYIQGREAEIFNLLGITGHGVAKLDTDTIENFQVLMLPLKEQKKIVEILSDCDTAIKKIENKRQYLSKIEKYYESELLNKPIADLVWKGDLLSNLLVKRSELSTISNQYEVYTSSRKGIFKQTEYFSKQVASEDNAGYGIIRNGDFTYRAMTDDDTFVFNLFEDEVGLVSPAYSVFTAKECDSIFLKKFLNCSRFSYELKKVAQGGTRKSLKFSSLTSININLPDYHVQQKIGAVFIQIEIEASSLGKQLDLLQQQKRGLMQQLLTGKLRVKGAI